MTDKERVRNALPNDELPDPTLLRPHNVYGLPLYPEVNTDETSMHDGCVFNKMEMEGVLDWLNGNKDLTVTAYNLRTGQRIKLNGTRDDIEDTLVATAHRPVVTNRMMSVWAVLGGVTILTALMTLTAVAIRRRNR